MIKVKKNSKRRFFQYLYLLIFIAIISVIFTLFYAQRNKSPVPPNIKRGVNFQIYYPDQKKLPNGYKLNIKSFTKPRQDVILYTVYYGNGKKLIFSVQPKPSDDEIQRFYSNYIPLRNQVQLNLGQAQVGSYGNPLKTVVSYPIDNGPWVIVTAPVDTDQNKLKQVLNTLKF